MSTLSVSTLDVDTIDSKSGTSLAFTSDVKMPTQFSHRNKIINGNMNIAQRGTSFTGIGSSGAYTLDRYFIDNNSDGAITVSQQADAPSDNEFQSSLRVAVTTADTSITTTQNTRVSQFIEGYNVRDLIGKTFTLSFRVSSSKTGIHCVSFRNSGSNRSYLVEYTVNSANTWETKNITVTGGLPTAGTWNWTNGAGLLVGWALAAGTTYQTTANAWQTGNFLATANQVNCLDTIGNIFAITGVQLEVGSVATPFEHRPYGVELALCQRYLPAFNSQNTTSCLGAGQCLSSSSALIVCNFPVEARVAPTGITVSSLSHFSVRNNTGGAQTFATSATGAQVSKTSGELYLQGGSGLVAGYATVGFFNNSAGNLLFTGCEL